MRTLLALIPLLAASLLLSACTEPEPAYKADLLAYDPGLVGTWRFEQEKDGKKTIVDLVVTERTLGIENGRTKPEPLPDPRKAANAAAPGPPSAPKPPNAYVLQIRTTGEKGEEIEIELKGLSVKYEGMTLLGAQPSFRQLEKAHLSSLVVPLHMLVRIKRDSDTLTVQTSKTPVAWAYDMTWLDGPKEPPVGPPDLGKLDEGPRRITTDIDRLLEVYRTYGAKDEFWSEPVVLKRR